MRWSNERIGGRNNVKASGETVRGVSWCAGNLVLNRLFCRFHSGNMGSIEAPLSVSHPFCVVPLKLLVLLAHRRPEFAVISEGLPEIDIVAADVKRNSLLFPTFLLQWEKSQCRIKVSKVDL
jgi:hypothetical protein